ncbi:hypothetical protein PYW08_015099 [Mythimna loreyi]|uniref:Uncharacterized protein n=1 Tax=Mythimna loreyi TaxID=667449 RepID=A0ACC2R4E1_9NEOP|nr:hypothetical protein PYW08_015099 [Mythimna loreyi]
MESSSENSFAWTDTSSDSTSMAADDIIEYPNKNDVKETKGKKSKKKHEDQSVSLEPSAIIKEEKAYFDSKSNSSVKKEHIKIELDSDNDIKKKKKNIKNVESNGNHNYSQDSISYDESYLDMKVEQESSSSKHKKKKKRNRTSSIDLSTTPFKSHENNSGLEMYSDHVTIEEETENDTEIRKTKKKKKSKKKYDCDHPIPDFEEKMDVEETVVNSNNKGNDSDSFVTENTALQEENEESVGDEISLIKCDDSHTAHTLSFNNKASIQNSNKKLDTAKYRKQRISDRILFEDDDDDDDSGDDTNIQSSHVNHASNSENSKKQLKRFLKYNPNLKQLPQTYNNSMSITRDDEIWILKCPKEININDFNKTTLNIQGKSKIKVGGQSYEGNIEEEQSGTLSLLTIEQNNYKIRNFQLNGTINLRKRIPKAHFRDDNVMVNNQTNFIPLPETKCRHPLFGSNYKKALKIPAAIAERLNVQDTEDTLLRATKRKKKKNSKETNTSKQVSPLVSSDITMKTEPEFSLEIREKKKKKRKLMDDENPTPKKVKRIKHDPESAEAWESEKAIEENLFNF